MIKYNEEIKNTHDETDETECNEDMSLYTRHNPFCINTLLYHDEPSQKLKWSLLQE